MSTVKISDLPVITHLDTNTANTIFVGVDIPTNTTGRITAKVIAEGLYANDQLKVGNEEIIFSNVIAQFAGPGTPYLQVHLQNTDANSSGDFVITSDNGTDANNYIDMGINGSKYFSEDFSAQSKLDGYLYTYGSLSNSYDGNLIIGTASTGANVVFAVGGQRKANVVAKMSRYGLAMNGASYIEFADGSKQSVSAAPANYTQSSFDKANTASANTVILQGVNVWQNTQTTDVNTFVQSGYNVANSAASNTVVIQAVNLTQNTNITTANNAAWAAFDKANNALANTTGTFAGSLTITGNLRTTGIVSVNNSTFNSNTALMYLTASDGYAIAPASNSNYMLHITGKANSTTRVVVDSFGVNTYPLIAGRMGRGSAAAPAAVANSDVLMRIAGQGYTGTQFVPSSPTKIDFVAAENFSDTNRGTRIEFWNTAPGSNTIQKVASFNANTVDFLGAVNPEKGFIYTPVIYPSAQTAITIDISDGPLVRAQTATGLTVTLSNFVTGKVVELWVTNTDNNNRTFTHGVSAINSTVGSTSYTMVAGSTICARYVCIDGTLANTMCAIIHA